MRFSLRGRGTVRMVAVAIVSGLVAAAVSVSPALAEDSKPITGAHIELRNLSEVSLNQNSREDGRPGTLSIELERDGDIAPDISVVIDASKRGVLSIASDDGQCANTAPAVLACDFGDRMPGEIIEVDVVLWVTETARVNNHVNIDIKVSMSGGVLATTGWGLYVVFASYDSEYISIEGIDPGSSVDVPLRFRLGGSTAQTGMEVRITSSSWTSTFAADYGNCGPDPDQTEDVSVICVLPDFEGVPGAVYRLADHSPVTFTINELASGPTNTCGWCSYTAVVKDRDVLNERLAAISNGADELFSLEVDENPREWTPHPGDRRDRIVLNTTVNPFDLEAVDTRIDGATGDVVDVSVPIRNNGPASAWPEPQSRNYYWVYIKLPTGVKYVAGQPDTGREGDWCSDGLDPDWAKGETGIDGVEISCALTSVAAHEQVMLNFTFEILDGSEYDDGVIYALERPEQTQDRDLDNNLAALTLNTGASGGVDGTLPVTGASLGWWIGGGTAIAAAGVLGVVLLRRRQVALTW